MKNIRTICVFCSSSDVIDDKYMQVASELGMLIGKKGLKLVHGAGRIGLMGALSRAAKEEGSYITGVIPEALNRDGIASEIDDKIIVTPTMHERKEIMRNMSDAFIALPGGFGTLEELMEVITLKQLRYHKKPVVIINTNDFFRNLLLQFEQIFSEQFAKKDYSSLYFVAINPENAFSYLEDYKYSIATDKWF